LSNLDSAQLYINLLGLTQPDHDDDDSLYARGEIGIEDENVFRDYYANLLSFYMQVAAKYQYFLFIPAPEVYFRALVDTKRAQTLFYEALYKAANESNSGCPGIFTPGNDQVRSLDSGNVPVLQVGIMNSVALARVSRGKVATCVMGNTWTAGSGALSPHISAMEEGLTRLTGAFIPYLFNAHFNGRLLDVSIWTPV
jgi:hypothetical protein